MGRNHFTLEQIEVLRKNKYVKRVSEKGITYTEEFKEIFLIEYKSGHLPSQILSRLGFDPKALGPSRIGNITKRIMKQAKRADGFKDTRAENSGRPSVKDLSEAEMIKRQKDQIEYLKQQVEFLSDLRRLEREAMWKKSKSGKNSK